MTASCRVANQDRAAYNEALQILRTRADYTHDPDFTSRAKCAGEDPNLFYPDSGPGGFHAKKICAKCPVWIDCLLMSMTTPETTNLGIFGRMGPPTRKYLKRELGISSEAPFLWWQEYWAGNPGAPNGTREYTPRTHCRNGHEYTPENTLQHKGYKRCRECRVRQREEYLAKRTEGKVA